MDNTNNTNNDNWNPQQTLDMIEKFDEQIALLSESKENFLRQARERHGKTFEHEGKYYQIRERYSKPAQRRIMYICTLKSLPAEWLRKGREERQREKEQRLAAAGIPIEPKTTTPEVQPEASKEEVKRMLDGFNDLIRGMYGQNTEIVME